MAMRNRKGYLSPPFRDAQGLIKDLVARVVFLMLLALLEVFEFYWIKEALFGTGWSHGLLACFILTNMLSWLPSLCSLALKEMFEA